MFKMNKMEDHYLWIEYRNQNFESPYLKQAPFKYSKEKFASETDHFVILPKFTQNFLQLQNEQN